MTKVKYTRTTIRVTGRGLFPMDMLRYDNCVVVEGSIEGRDERTLRLRRFSQGGKAATSARWQSFGWTVMADSANGDMI